MRPLDYFVNFVLSTILIVGTYQFYFLTQRYQLAKVRTFNFKIDEAMPYWPVWAWVYSFFYYPVALFVVSPGILIHSAHILRDIFP